MVSWKSKKQGKAKTMIQRTIEFKNPKGMHLRPTSALVKLAKSFKSNIHILVPNQQKVKATDLLHILSLGIASGPITFEADGEDEKEALDAIENLLNNFDLDS